MEKTSVFIIVRAPFLASSKDISETADIIVARASAIA
jgi:hypothetical protein